VQALAVSQTMVLYLAQQNKADLAVLSEPLQAGKATGHRPDARAEQGHRGHPLPRTKTRQREGRQHRVTRPRFSVTTA